MIKRWTNFFPTTSLQPAQIYLDSPLHLFFLRLFCFHFQWPVSCTRNIISNIAFLLSSMSITGHKRCRQLLATHIYFSLQHPEVDDSVIHGSKQMHLIYKDRLRTKRCMSTIFYMTWLKNTPSTFDRCGRPHS